MRALHLPIDHNYGNIVRHRQIRSNLIVKSYIASKRSRILGGIPAMSRDSQHRHRGKSTITNYSTRTERAVTRTLTVKTKNEPMAKRLALSAKTEVVME